MAMEVLQGGYEFAKQLRSKNADGYENGLMTGLCGTIPDPQHGIAISASHETA